MTDNKDNHQPAGLFFLEFYQWFLVLIALGYSSAVTVFLATGEWKHLGEQLVFLGINLVPACWGIAMAIASNGIKRRSPRGFVLGMICHLILEIPALVMILMFLFGGGVNSLGEGGVGGAFASLGLLCALVLLPFVLISGWAFFYLRRLRKSLLAQGPQNVAGLMP